MKLAQFFFGIALLSISTWGYTRFTGEPLPPGYAVVLVVAFLWLAFNAFLKKPNKRNGSPHARGRERRG